MPCCGSSLCLAVTLICLEGVRCDPCVPSEKFFVSLSPSKTTCYDAEELLEGHASVHCGHLGEYIHDGLSATARGGVPLGCGSGPHAGPWRYADPVLSHLTGQDPGGGGDAGGVPHRLAPVAVVSAISNATHVVVRHRPPSMSANLPKPGALPGHCGDVCR